MSINEFQQFIQTDKGAYKYAQLEENKGIHGYDYTIKVSINGDIYFLYFAEIPHRNEVLGWNVMLIEEDVYEKIVRKEITKEFNVIHFFGQRSFKTAETPYVVIKLIEDMMISKKEKKI